MKNIAKPIKRKPKEPKKEVYGPAMVPAQLVGCCCFYWFINFYIPIKVFLMVILCDFESCKVMLKDNFKWAGTDFDLSLLRLFHHSLSC